MLTLAISAIGVLIICILAMFALDSSEDRIREQARRRIIESQNHPRVVLGKEPPARLAQRRDKFMGKGLAPFGISIVNGKPFCRRGRRIYEIRDTGNKRRRDLEGAR